MRILVVDDEADLLDALSRGLRREGYAVDTANDGEEALAKASWTPYDLICLDLTMQGIDGLEVCARLRAEPPGGVTPRILMLTARDTLEDRIRGLDVGADDYLVKPFAFDELTARIRTLLRRDSGGSGAVLEVGDVVVDTEVSPRIFEEWLAKTRPGPGPGGLRRPLWMARPVKPKATAYGYDD